MTKDSTGDIIIRGAMVADGTGRPCYPADIAVMDGRITAIGQLDGLRAKTEIDASGLVAAPGFIDAHAHSDTSFRQDDSSASKLYQGITTEISGNCGGSPFPALPDRKDNDPWSFCSYEDFLTAFEHSHCRMGVNQAMLVGHGTLRKGVMGEGSECPTKAQLDEMRRLLRRDLAAGAIGMSLGLEYATGCFAQQAELNSLGEVVAEYNGIVTCHMRSEGLRIREAIAELAEIGRSSGVRTHISHLKLDHYSVHGQARDVWNIIENARREGIRLTADVYPYTASATTLDIRCPRWSLDGGEQALLSHLRGPRRQAVVDGIRAHYFNAERAETCQISYDGGLWPEIVGKTLRTIAETMLNTTDYADAAAEILLRTEDRATGVFFVMSEADMLYFLSKDVCIGSDGYALSGDPARVHGSPHPRSYGAIAEFLRLAREKHICSLPEAVRRITSKPADLFGLTDRGRLAVGKAADITIFDPDTIAPQSDYLHPVRLARGVHWVLVNGTIALADGVQTDVRSGQFLRKQRPAG